MLEDLPDGFWHALLLLLPGNEALQLSRVSRTLRRRVSTAPALNAGVTVGLSTLEVGEQHKLAVHPAAGGQPYQPCY